MLDRLTARSKPHCRANWKNNYELSQLKMMWLTESASWIAQLARLRQIFYARNTKDAQKLAGSAVQHGSTKFFGAAGDANKASFH